MAGALTDKSDVPVHQRTDGHQQRPGRFGRRAPEPVARALEPDPGGRVQLGRAGALARPDDGLFRPGQTQRQGQGAFVSHQPALRDPGQAAAVPEEPAPEQGQTDDLLMHGGPRGPSTDFEVF